MMCTINVVASSLSDDFRVKFISFWISSCQLFVCFIFSINFFQELDCVSAFL